jgi:hypothetical protein
MASFEYTLLESANGEPVTKEVSLRTDGKIQKTSLAFNLCRGTATTITATPAEFVTNVSNLRQSQAHAYGTMIENEFSKIVTKADVASHNFNGDGIPRANETFEYKTQAGISMGDIDDSSITVKYLWEFFTKLDSRITEAPLIYMPSTGSCIYDNGGNQLIGVNGFRLYQVVDNVSLVPEYAKILHDHAWLEGMGHYKISKAGTLLDRGPLDNAVFQPSRIDFCAGAVCKFPLQQKRSFPKLLNADAPFLDIASVMAYLKLTPLKEKTLLQLKTQARQNKEGEAKEVREAWIAARTAEIAANQGVSHEIAESIVRKAIETSQLSGEFELLMQDGERVTVAQVLENPTKYHGKHCADPLEPDCGDNRIGYLSLQPGQKARLYSHLHGGHSYSLTSTRHTILVVTGDTVIAVDETVKILQAHPQVFDKGNQLVLVDSTNPLNVEIEVVDELNTLSDFLAHEIRFKKNEARQSVITQVNADPPVKVCQQIISRGKRRKLKSLRSVTTVPFMRKDGSICDMAGYDDQTGMLLVLPTGVDASVPLNPTIEMTFKAVKFLWEAFKFFPFADSISRSVFFSALLTTVCRRDLQTAPGFVIDATTAGTGKSMLCSSLGILNEGALPGVLTRTSNSEEETRKLITSALLASKETMIFDNIEGAFRSATIEAFLTAPVFNDRLLGGNKIVTLPNTAMFIVNGNNIRISGDLNRRLLPIRLDAQVEDPHLRKFALDPIAHVTHYRLDIIRSLLLVMRGYLSSGAGVITTDRLASFEDWDALVRQTVCWLSTLEDCPITLVDPKLAIDNNYQNDARKGELKLVLSAWFDYLGTTPITLKQLFVLDAASIFDTDEVQVAKKNKLLDAIAEIDGVADNRTKPPVIDSKKFGTWLNNNHGRIVSGFKFTKATGKLDGYTRWQISVTI